MGGDGSLAKIAVGRRISVGFHGLQTFLTRGSDEFFFLSYHNFGGRVNKGFPSLGFSTVWQVCKTRIALEYAYLLTMQLSFGLELVEYLILFLLLPFRFDSLLSV